MVQEDTNGEKMNEKCRLCLEAVPGNEGTSIVNDKFRKKLQNVFLFSICDDGPLPVQVCQRCDTAVSEFHTYSQQVRANQELLRQVVEANEDLEEVKLEPTRTAHEFSTNESNDDEDVPPSPERVILVVEPVHGAASGEASDSSDEGTGGRNSESTPLNSSGKSKAKDKPDTNSLVRQQEKDERIKEFYTLECEICSARMESFAQLQEHYPQEHGTRCYIRCCNKQFFHRYTLIDHIAVHRGTIKCEFCQKSYKTRRYLALHIAKSHGSEADRPYRCDKCGVGYPKRYLLRAHEMLHVQEECRICKKVLSSHHALKVHVAQMHSNDANQICATCGKMFRTKVAMERHMKEHLGLDLVEKMQCLFCQKWFNGKYNLKKHMRYLHYEEGQVFRCDVCQHESPNSRALAYHKQRVHVEEKHECEYCGKRFKRRLYLREHIASHTGKPLYTCDICGVQFNSHANHFTHRKNKHPIEWETQKRLRSIREKGRSDDQPLVT